MDSVQPHLCAEQRPRRGRSEGRQTSSTKGGTNRRPDQRGVSSGPAGAAEYTGRHWIFAGPSGLRASATDINSGSPIFVPATLDSSHGGPRPSSTPPPRATTMPELILCVRFRPASSFGSRIPPLSYGIVLARSSVLAGTGTTVSRWEVALSCGAIVVSSVHSDRRLTLPRLRLNLSNLPLLLTC